MALEFIDVVDANGRTSHFTVCDRAPKLLRVGGGLEHGAEIAPRTVSDARALIAHLRRWIDAQPDHVGALKTFYRMVGDGDAWGDCMGAFFNVAGELYNRQADIPDEWGYSPGQVGSGDAEVNELWGFEFDGVPDADLIRFGNLLDRYSRMLRSAGRDY